MAGMFFSWFMYKGGWGDQCPPCKGGMISGGKPYIIQEKNCIIHTYSGSFLLTGEMFQGFPFFFVRIYSNILTLTTLLPLSVRGNS
jgi:hypothetical protein